MKKFLMPLSLALLIVLISACGGGDPTEESTVPTLASGLGTGKPTAEQHPITNSEHLDRDVTFTGYSTTPPTSGRHWSQRNPDAPVACGIYDEELRDEQTTHNLEHGNVIISYNLSDPQMISDLEEAARDMPSRNRWLVMRPYSQIPMGEIAMSAWGWLQRFDSVDPEGMRGFYEAHFGNGPEFINC